MKRTIAAMMLLLAVIGWSEETRAEISAPAADQSRPCVRIEDQALPLPDRDLTAELPVSSLGEKAAPAEWVNSRIFGQFGYLDPDGHFQPAFHLDYRIYVRAPFGGPVTEYGTGTLDANGIFDRTVWWDAYTLPGMTESVLRIDVITEDTYGIDMTVVDPGDNWEPYRFTLFGIPNTDNSLILYGVNVPSDEIDNGAVHITAQGNRALDRIRLEWNESLHDIEVYYPSLFPPPGGDYEYRGWVPSHVLSVLEESMWRDDHLFRLLGHAWHHEYAAMADHELCNSVCDGTAADCGFCDWCVETGLAAWNEGFGLYFADLATGWLLAESGPPTLNLRDFESLGSCAPFPDSPNNTPGFAAALLEDLTDPVDPWDDHPQFPGLTDAVGGMGPAILTIMKDHSPTSAVELLTLLMADQPSLTVDLWETGANCGFDLDAASPGAVNNLASTSHTVTLGSDDATVDLVWTAATDDMSGIAGYGLSWSTIPSMPPQVITFAGDVTSGTSGPLSPGTWYLNLRSVDRAGNWSSTYRAVGPFAIQVAAALDLAYRVETFWDYVSFPSQGLDNTALDAHLTPVMTGDISTNHYNLCGQNLGPGAANNFVYLHAVVDGELVSGEHVFTSLLANQVFRSPNLGSFFVSGGRHNFYTVIDGRDLNTETDEDNNYHGGQFVWTGSPLTAGVPLQRTAPPILDAGGDHVPSASWFVCDGLSFQSAGWWNAVAVRPLAAGTSYAARLHVGSTGSEDGFGVNLAFSARPENTLNAVIVNRNTMGSAAWDVGVLNGVEGGPDYEAVLVNSASMTFGDSLNVTLPANERIMLREFYIAPEDTGRVSVTVNAGSGQENVGVNWLGRDFQTGTLLNGDVVTWTDADGRALLELHLTEIGYYCLVIYRDDLDVSAPLTMVVESGPAMPDVATSQPVGWDAPLVPRPADDGTFSSVAFPDTLHGNVPSTWFNYATQNLGYGDAVDSDLNVEVDGEMFRSINYGWIPAGAVWPVNYGTAYTVRGGRHMMVLKTDAMDNVEEIDETNNVYGRSWVWGPLEVPIGTTLNRASPPDPVGGFGDAGLSWYNCDGLRYPEPVAFWSAAAVMPTDLAANPDVRLHLPAAGTQTGFAANLATSNWGPGESDYVLTNHNFQGPAAHDVGVIRGSATAEAPYQVEMVETLYLGSGSSGSWGPYTMGGNEIIDLYEWSMSPGIYQIVLENESGNVDWGISLHRQDLEHQGKSTVLDGGTAWMRGGGENEYLTVEVPENAFTCLAVWKRGTADLALTGTYNLRIQFGLSGVEEQVVPAVTRLGHAVPNPFNPSTTIHYELARAGRVRLTVYDLTGARIAELRNAAELPGPHRVVWSGLDNSGRPVSSGVYMARLTVDGESAGVMKLALLK